jgi:hypothetical protein
LTLVGDFNNFAEKSAIDAISSYPFLPDTKAFHLFACTVRVYRVLSGSALSIMLVDNVPNYSLAIRLYATWMTIRIHGKSGVAADVVDHHVPGSMPSPAQHWKPRSPQDLRLQ